MPDSQATTVCRLLAVAALTAGAFEGPASGAIGPGRAESIAPRIEAVTFPSDVLGRDKTFCVVLPRDYDAQRDDWPVLFLLHGRGRTERSLIDDPAARQSLLAADFFIILPDGDDGWYIDSPVRRPDRYEAYLTEVIAVAERRYHLSSDRSRRALSGWSMGGYGCTRYATRHPERFGALAPIIGLLDFPRTGLPPGQSYAVPRDRFGDDPDVWRKLNPLNHAERLRGMDLLVITADEAFDRTMNEHFHRRLEQQGIEHDWLVLEGGHTFDVVRRALPRVIEHTRRSFASTSESGE